MNAVVLDNIGNGEVKWCGIGEEPGWYHFRRRDGLRVGDIHTIYQQTAMGASCGRGVLSRSHDPEADNRRVHSNTHQVSLPSGTHFQFRNYYHYSRCRTCSPLPFRHMHAHLPLTVVTPQRGLIFCSVSGYCNRTHATKFVQRYGYLVLYR